MLDVLGDGAFIPCMHSVGAPLSPDGPDAPWPCEAVISRKYIVHFPETYEIWSYGSGYGGNALLGKKCFALRVASVMAREEGWLAEHMLITGMKTPTGEKTYFGAASRAFAAKPISPCWSPPRGWKAGKSPPLATTSPGSRQTRGQFAPINPEAGFSASRPDERKHEPKRDGCCAKNAIFTNVALTDDGDVWWEGMRRRRPST